MKRGERAAALLEEVAKQIERGLTHVHINLPWGQVEWRASTTTIHGKTRDSDPFTIEHVSSKALLRWLRGVPARLAFPEMDPEDRTLLATGLVTKAHDHDMPVFALDAVYHPGVVVLEYLYARMWSQQDLARETGLTLVEVTAICKCEAPITPAIAVLLERALRRPAQFWLNHQKLYDESIAR